MNIPDDATYYAEREASEKRRAEVAADPTARYAHITMAAEYRRLAAEARRRAGVSLESAHTITSEPAAGGVTAHQPSAGQRHQRQGAPARAASTVTADRTSSPEARR